MVCTGKQMLYTDAVYEQSSAGTQTGAHQARGTLRGGAPASFMYLNICLKGASSTLVRRACFNGAAALVGRAIT